MTTINKCSQCGSDLIETKRTETLVNKSVVISIVSVCSDSACQKRIEKYKSDRIIQQNEIELNRRIREKEAGARKRENQLILGPKSKTNSKHGLN